MVQKKSDTKMTELGTALLRTRSALIGVGVFSAVINILMLTGPLYMLQVYDRVLISRSMSTLVALSLLMAGLYAFLGGMEFIRSRVLVRIGNRIEEDLKERTFGIWLKQGLYGKLGATTRPLDDLSSVKNFMSGPGPGTIFDLPWTPLFIAVIWMLHWTLGVAALIGAILVFIVASLNELTTRKALTDARQQLGRSRQIAEDCHRHSETVTAMGMSRHIMARWQNAHEEGARLHTIGSDRAGGYSATTKSFRMFLQSAILGLGGGLAVLQIITPGAMIAASIIMGRALAPVQMAIGQWKGFINARAAYNRLNLFYKAVPALEESLQLPDPKGHISMQGVTMLAPGSGETILTNVSFEINPGQGLGVIGPSAAGKSTLARLLVGLWIPRNGFVRLDGATFDQWDMESLGRHIGYLPQDAALFDGTIKDNIARFDPQAADEAVVQAAQWAGVHEMILKMPKGYETSIGREAVVLSGGQVQRIALARALYGDPKLVVLDEPNANLDNEGDTALSAAIMGSRKRGNTVIIMTHRPSAIASVDMLLLLNNGRVEDFGPKEQVLKTMQEKHKKHKKREKQKPKFSALSTGGVTTGGTKL